MTYANAPHEGPALPAEHREDVQDVAALLAVMKDVQQLLKRHVFGSPEHLEVVKGLTRQLQALQSEGLVTSYDLGHFTHDTIHVHVFVSLENFTLEKRQRVRRELRTVGRAHGLYVDSHIQPDLTCGETE